MFRDVLRAVIRDWGRRLAALTGAAPTLGRRGEQVAERYLKRLGYKIVARGVRFRRGELDLVAVDGRTVVFVEVKARQSHQQGLPAEAVDAEKQRALTRAALLFLKRHALLEHQARFDVLAITFGPGEPVIEHIRSAFEAVGQGQLFS